MMLFCVCCFEFVVAVFSSLSPSLKYLRAQGGQVHNTCTCTLLDLKLLLSLDIQGGPTNNLISHPSLTTFNPSFLLCPAFNFYITAQSSPAGSRLGL